MTDVGFDVVLEVVLRDFAKHEVRRKSQVIIEHGREIPFSKASSFIADASVSCGGTLQLHLEARPTSGTARGILDENHAIPCVGFTGAARRAWNAVKVLCVIYQLSASPSKVLRPTRGSA